MFKLEESLILRKKSKICKSFGEVWRIGCLQSSRLSGCEMRPLAVTVSGLLTQPAELEAPRDILCSTQVDDMRNETIGGHCQCPHSTTGESGF